MPPDSQQELFYRIALTFVKDVGSITARKLVAHFGTATDVFKASLKELKAVSGLGEVRARAFIDDTILKRAEEELEYIDKNAVSTYWFFDDDYPARLKDCADAPILLYYSGQDVLHKEKVVAVIGTRKYTDYGQRVCEHLIADLKAQDILIVSGLAHGIDSIAHNAALQNGLPTVGVLGHGLDMVYPASNKKLAKQMQETGGLLCEYPSGSTSDRAHFPMRNRIVAGMSDVTVVIESDVKGGALITARLADSYNRDVAAFPGRVYDNKSSGCNELIRTNIAAMITGADDLLELMNWNDGTKPKLVQRQLFLNLSSEEQAVYDVLKDKDSVHADELLHLSGLSNSMLAGTLLGMEMQGLVKALPGKFYRLD
ncbi:MAG: DNA-processing protein DprA [Chitinophagaceae bacterium]|nr:DNA-processing protein DprA [Chitinophagaceae bacterium]